ncbi:MAG: hypothetical protein KJO01_02405 [Gammaproteobacteria bacterium]|nr:hypothetical protein [Gammaproteobacteria bacterium]MBT8109392.1 hypothetical protein [Gammaproteobacteria bacterium]NND46458.1 hypothetical protein [Woeseiaceae bacterium]NNL44094.1 hypothetical protein [Woeseiaceae bacterium]
MTDDNEIIDWRKLREFAAVDLTRSFVLSWHVEGDILIIDIDIYLMPEHPFYENPRPAEKVCIRPASIEFPFCESLRPHGRSGGELVDIASNLGHGALTDLRRLSDAHYEISGEFGTVFVDAERPLLRLK